MGDSAPAPAAPAVLSREPSFTMGVEEEYLLVDPETRDLIPEPGDAFWSDLEVEVPGRCSPEFLQAQVEVGTGVHRDISGVGQDLEHLRRTVAAVSERYGFRMMAASTHPIAAWRDQKTTVRDRYLQLQHDLGHTVQRLAICAMHTHVGIEDDDLRIDLMNQAKYFLPHLLALTTSSAFWQRRETGLQSYRLSVFKELPRTGLPEQFDSFAEYDRHLSVLTATGVIEDATKIWWDLRPSARFPTLEMRICDICTRVEDGLVVAALYQAILRMLWRLRRSNTQWRRYTNFLIEENRWRAARYGSDEGLIDFGRSRMTSYDELLDEVLDLVAEDAEALGSRDVVIGAREILKRGTSAHNQRRVYHTAKAEGATADEALIRVVDWLIETSSS